MLKNRLKKLEKEKIPRHREVKLLYVENDMVVAINGTKVAPYAAPKNALELR